MRNRNSIFNILILIGFVSCSYNNYTCDYKFGDPSWDYSKVFHDKNHVIAPGITHKNIYLTESKLIISFVCINLSGANLKTTRVAFVSLFKRITVQFEEPYNHDVTAHVLAMHHGY